ncbi:MAG TPA: WbqC family protein [bacterium]|nr:WbqC family protein [bacterium]
MIVAIHQPHYLPWLRYIDKIARSDVFVLLDDAAYTKNGWQNRNKIKCAQGWMYLTVPVVDAFGKRISDVCINNQERWREKHWMAIRTNYARAPFLHLYQPALADIYAAQWPRLVDLSEHVLAWLVSVLGIRTRIVRSSDLGISGRGTQRIVDICAALGATTYLTGDYAADNHLDAPLFEGRGIEVGLQGWECRTYRQQHMRLGFVPDLSIIDLLFNEGEAALSILARCRREASEAVASGNV